MTAYTKRSNLSVSKSLDKLIETEILPGTNIDLEHFWHGFSKIIEDLTDKNRELLMDRTRIQGQINRWHRAHDEHDPIAYKAFLKDIGYLVPEGPDFEIETEAVDSEICQQAGPQLVVPVNNARFALNAANARWGSLYDALYGTDAISEEDGAERSANYNSIRGAKVIQYAKNFLDEIAPLDQGSHQNAIAYNLQEGVSGCFDFRVDLDNGVSTKFSQPQCVAGFTGNKEALKSLLLCHNNLHIELQFDRQHPIGKEDSAGMKDILLESAVTTIMDCEDSVAAVDDEDKTQVYRNWLGLIKGDLVEQFEKNGEIKTRHLNADRLYETLSGESLKLPGRSLMFVRNVGHHMTNPSIFFKGHEVFEGLMDAVVTSLIALHDIGPNGCYKNSRTGSVYIVKPKMHGPEEVEFTDILFGRVEQLLGLPENTLKMGIMDEERRTTVNLKECIRAAKKRVVFINTGFLDRTGDEIHTSMEAGPFAPKSELKERDWIHAYEDQNVDIGLACGFSGKAQIGKGMWAVPDHMADMMARKICHPHSGASTAWVPSPTAAVLHAIHYHKIDVAGRQKELMSRERAEVDRILDIPLLAKANPLTERAIQRELDNNVQGILGYVVRWIEQGIGCSKVPDIKGVGLMEDRATLRISSQHIANWLHHDICSHEQVLEVLKRMAEIVDHQNDGDPDYRKIAEKYGSSFAFQAACHLIFKGCEQPNGYTEPVLHMYRKQAKKAVLEAAK